MLTRYKNSNMAATNPLHFSGFASVWLNLTSGPFTVGLWQRLCPELFLRERRGGVPFVIGPTPFQFQSMSHLRRQRLRVADGVDQFFGQGQSLKVRKLLEIWNVSIVRTDTNGA